MCGGGGVHVRMHIHGESFGFLFLCFTELAHVVIEASKSKICAMSLRAGDQGKASATVQV